MTKHQNQVEKLISELCPNGVELFKLDEIAEITAGEFVHKNKQNPNGEIEVSTNYKKQGAPEAGGDVWHTTGGGKTLTDFIALYGAILRVRNILATFDEFAGNEILTDSNVQDYHSKYIDMYNTFRKSTRGEKENVNDDIVFEMELIKQPEINIDYILGLIKEYHEEHAKNRELLIGHINKAIDSSVELRNKKDLINQFIASLDDNATVEEGWQKFVEEKKIEELEKIIEAENLNHDAAYEFIKNAFRDGRVATTGTAISKVLPPISRFSPGGERTLKKENVSNKFISFFKRFFDISGGKFSE